MTSHPLNGDGCNSLTSNCNRQIVCEKNRSSCKVLRMQTSAILRFLLFGSGVTSTKPQHKQKGSIFCFTLARKETLAFGTTLGFLHVEPSEHKLSQLQLTVLFICERRIPTQPTRKHVTTICNSDELEHCKIIIIISRTSRRT